MPPAARRCASACAEAAGVTRSPRSARSATRRPSCGSSRGDDRRSGGSCPQIFRFEYEVLDQGLVLDVRLVLGGSPVAALTLAHVLAIARHAGELHVVGY